MTPETTPPSISVNQALQQALEAGLEYVDAQHLLCGLLGQNRTWLKTHGDTPLNADQSTQWLAWLTRSQAGEPLAYLLGEQPFRQLQLAVNQDVLIPRADTEVLVNWAIEILTNHPTAQPSVVDLGTGSGAIALAIKQAMPAITMHAVDASEAALALAKRNAHRHQLAIEWAPSDWWSALRGHRFHLAVSNPPYIAEDDPHMADLRHEPRMALTSGPHGLDALHLIIQEASTHLHPGAWLLLEHGATQGPAVQEQLARHGFKDIITRPDLAARPRCTGGRWPSALSH